MIAETLAWMIRMPKRIFQIPAKALKTILHRIKSRWIMIQVQRDLRKAEKKMNLPTGWSKTPLHQKKMMIVKESPVLVEQEELH